MQLSKTELLTLAEGQNRLLTARSAFIAQLRTEGKESHANALQAIQDAQERQWRGIIADVKRIEQITARKGAKI